MAAPPTTTAGSTAPSRRGCRAAKLGALVPRLPTLQPNNGRLFPQTFHGGLVESREWEGLGFTLARLDEVSQRNEGGRSDLALYNRNKRFTAGPVPGIWIWPASIGRRAPAGC